MKHFVTESLQVGGVMLAGFGLLGIASGVWVWIKSWRHARRTDARIYNLAALTRNPEPPFTEDSAQWSWIVYQMDREKNR